MATKTNKLGLSKAELTDSVRSTLTANNENFDKLDDVITRLKANQISGTASGTEIVVTDSAEMESILHISGNSEQDSRSGKNLFNINGDVNTRYNGETSNTNTVSGNELTTTHNWGTAHGYGQRIYVGKGNTVTFSAKLKSVVSEGYTGTAAVAQLTCYNDGSAADRVNLEFSLSHIGTTKSLQFTAQTDYIYLTFGAYTTDRVSSATFTDIQLELGTEATEYEPYGAMPSPDYPSEIRSVKSKSDNLFDKNDLFATGKYLDSAGASISSGNDNWVISNYIEVEPNTKYIEWGSTESGGNPSTCFYNASHVFISAIKHNHKNPITYTTPENCKYIMTSVYVPDIDLFMIEKGSEQTIYQPYGYVPVEARVEGKNLLELKQKTLESGGITYVAQSDGTVIANGTSTAVSYYYSANSTRLQDLPKGTYTVSCFREHITNMQIKLVGEGGVTLLETGTSPKTIAFEEDIKCRVGIRVPSGVTLNNFVFYPQIERGTTATPHVPHVEPKTVNLNLGDIELRSTPDGTRDTFERVDGVWNKVENIGSEIFDGSDDEKWEFVSESVVKFRIKLANAKELAKDQSIPPNVFCKSFKAVDWNTAIKSEIDEVVAFSSSATSDMEKLRFKYSKFTDLESFKTWLSNNSMQVDYVLTTPIYTPITDPALISALDELEQLVLHKGYNRITVTGVNGVKAYLDLNYYKDINIVLDNINAKLGGV